MNDKRTTQNNKDKEIKPLYIPICGQWKNCCYHNANCQAELQYYPQTDTELLHHCGCD